jgi:hypothetical protein
VYEMPTNEMVRCLIHVDERATFPPLNVMDATIQESPHRAVLGVSNGRLWSGAVA